MTYLPGPFPPETNPPLETATYEPSYFEIADIKKGERTTITFKKDHNYVIQQQIRILLAITSGMQQINNADALVTEIPSPTSVIVNIDSRQFDPFISSPLYSLNPPQTTAIGSQNQTNIISTGRFIPDDQLSSQGAFKRI